MFAVNGILFNHESPRRGETFVTRKITRAVARDQGRQAGLRLHGQPRRGPRLGLCRRSTSRACGGCCRPTSPTTTCSRPASASLCASSSRSRSSHAGLDWEKHVRFDERYLRPTEVDALIGDPAKADDELGWKADGRRPRAGAAHGGCRHRGARARGHAVDRQRRAARAAGRMTASMTATESLHPGPLDRDATFYVAGHRGLVGSAIGRKLEASGFREHRRQAVGRARPEGPRRGLRLHVARSSRSTSCSRRRRSAASWRTAPTRSTSSATTCASRSNVMDAALANDVERVLFLGSSCIYPKFAEQPIREDSLLTGHLEPTNDAYAIAKIAGILHVAGGAPAVRPAVDLGDADEPLRPERQLLAEGVARPAGADPPLRRGRRRRAPAS